MTDHSLVFLGVEMDGWHSMPAMTIRGEVWPAKAWVVDDPECQAWAVCACGETRVRQPQLWSRCTDEQKVEHALVWAANDVAEHGDLAVRRERERAITDAACLYCFAPLETPGYCCEAHRLADRRRPDADVLAGVLEEFSESREPGPDQLSMF